jgi:hypothetical protein
VDVLERIVRAPEQRPELRIAHSPAKQHPIRRKHELGERRGGLGFSPTRHARIGVYVSHAQPAWTLRKASGRICSGMRTGESGVIRVFKGGAGTLC